MHKFVWLSWGNFSSSIQQSSTSSKRLGLVSAVLCMIRKAVTMRYRIQRAAIATCARENKRGWSSQRQRHVYGDGLIPRLHHDPADPCLTENASVYGPVYGGWAGAVRPGWSRWSARSHASTSVKFTISLDSGWLNSGRLDVSPLFCITGIIHAVYVVEETEYFII